MSDYDLQFQADLEKAQALSLESLALEQFRRQKQLNTPSVPKDRRTVTAGSDRDPPPALPPPPRRPARASLPSASADARTPSASPSRDDTDSDLISFASPTSKSSPDPHASFKEYIEQINKLGQQTEELAIVPKEQITSTMNNPYYNQGSPGYPYNAAYNYPPQYPQMPYPPSTPYGMPTPMPSPMPNYYYSPNQMDIPQYTQGAPPVYYTQTRMAAPQVPYNMYPPPYPQTPPAPYPTPQSSGAQYPQTPPVVAQSYNYTTTNMISRPARPVKIYPQLSQMHTYPPQPGTSVMQASNASGGSNATAETKGERKVTRNTSVVSNASNESSDTIGSLHHSMNLIDFGKSHSNQGSVRVSVLEAFDPLLTDQNNCEYAAPSSCSGSVYEEYDPLDFLYGETEMRDAPVYAVAKKREGTILPSPPPKTIPSVPAVQKRVSTNKLYDCIVKLHTKNYDNEHKAFLKMILDVRKEFVYTDASTNPGYVIAARSGGKYAPNTSIKVVVQHSYSDEPITFTSDVDSTIDHVILTVVCSLEEEISQDNMPEFMLRVYGANEYLQPGSVLSEYDYIRECVRLEKDVRLCLTEGKDDSLARTECDDARAAHITLDDLILTEGTPMLTFDSLSIVFETLEGELSRAAGEAAAAAAGGAGGSSPAAVFQAVKAVCALAGGVETLHVTHTLNAFAQACAGLNQNASGMVTPEITHDVSQGQYSCVSLRRASSREAVAAQCARVRDAVRTLVSAAVRTRLVDFALAPAAPSTAHLAQKPTGSHTVCESALVCVEAAHALPPCWAHDEYVLHAQLYHGTRALHRTYVTNSSKIENAGFYPRIIFDTWLNLEDIPINALPRESRLVLTLFGRTQQAERGDAAPPAVGPQRADHDHDHDDHDHKGAYNQEELGWAALQMFDYDGILASGTYFLPLWCNAGDKRLGPAPHLFHAPPHPHPILNIEIPSYAHSGVMYSSGVEGCRDLSRAELPRFDTLDGHTQSQLLHLIEQGTYQRMPTEGREVMWEKRQYLVQLPGALPLILLSANNWYGEHREHLINLLELWEKPSPLNALHLLLPCFPDARVRSYAAEQLGGLGGSACARLAPQLLQGWLRAAHAAAAPAPLLLRQALASPAAAHHLLTHFHQSQPDTLGISIEENANVLDWSVTSTWRIKLLMRALMLLCGDRLADAMARQHLLVQTLSQTADSVKSAKEGGRQRALAAGAGELAAQLTSPASTSTAAAVATPLGLSLAVRRVDVRSCSYFSSNTLPLKINFIGLDDAVIPAMFKVGDDLRQDALVLQIIKVMDILWLDAGLDLRMVTFKAVPTSAKKGMIEIVQQAETLRAIQTEWGLTGSFKDKPIAEWLAKHNPSELEYQRARDNFTASVAGYSVATYLLGICDRHNDNIMLKTSGHLFHIDFGKFLGDAQMFGNFKRDRAPFVLTHDMAYVINGGERPSQRFHHFVELCCMAFNIVRAHSSHILDLIALMATSGVTGVTSSAVSAVRAALLPAASNAEAAAAFARLIHSSLRSRFTPINFFLHSLAQMRASGDQNSNTSELLSFMPRTYTAAQEGRLVQVECLDFEKRYDPEKHYVYSLRVFRQGHATPSVIYRSYRHFTELYQKICLHFPLAKVHSLPSGLYVGRSNVRQVAERRFADVRAFLASLFSLADEIAHSDLVYTFFHPLLRDQQDVEPQRTKKKDAVEAESEGGGSGSLKLSVQYAGGVLAVLVLHAQSLALTPQGLPPNAYVKVYLVPDPSKETKRKTKVLKRNSHPSFMEMLEYRLPLETVRTRSLRATVWHYDSLQENTFLGGVVLPLDSLDLRQETVAWYPLEYIPR